MTDVKTCSEWYELDTTKDIVDPDGFFRRSEVAAVFWYYVPVTKTFYQKKSARCSTTTYQRFGHRQPFVHTADIKKSFGKYCEHPLSSLIFSLLFQDLE